LGASKAHERPNPWFLDIFISNQWLSLPALLKRKSMFLSLSLSLPSPLLSSPLLSSPLPSWIEKANLVTKDKENQKSK
jgi:hypothetical protein